MHACISVGTVSHCWYGVLIIIIMVTLMWHCTLCTCVRQSMRKLKIDFHSRAHTNAAEWKKNTMHRSRPNSREWKWTFSYYLRLLFSIGASQWICIFKLIFILSTFFVKHFQRIYDCYCVCAKGFQLSAHLRPRICWGIACTHPFHTACSQLTSKEQMHN